MRSTLEKKTLLFVYGFLAVIALILGTIIYPTIKYIHSVNVETTNLRQYLENRYQNALNLRGSKKQVDEVKNEIVSYAQYLFAPTDVLKLITLLEENAEKNKVSQKINSSDLDKIGEKIHMNITASGQYKNVLNYLADIENSQYFITEKNIQISSGSNLQNNLADYANMNLDLILYVNR